MKKFVLGIPSGSFQLEEGDLKITHIDLIKANNNSFYKNKLKSRHSIQINSKLLEWSLKLNYENDFSSKFKNSLGKKILIRVIYFSVYFSFQLCFNYWSALTFQSSIIYPPLKKPFWLKLWFFIRFVYWSSLERFMLQTNPRLTVVNIVINRNLKLLLAKRHNNWIPGDIGWAWFQGGVEKKIIIRNNHNLKLQEEKILIESAAKELQEETNIDLSLLHVLNRPYYSGIEYNSISLRRFFYQKLAHNSQQKFLVFWSWEGGDQKIETNWENSQAGWYDFKEAKEILVPDKKYDLEKALKIISQT